MYKDAMILVAKLAFKAHPILFPAAILAATYAILYKARPRAPPPTPSVDFAEMEHEGDDSGNTLLDCESLASEPSVHSACDLFSDVDSLDSSWIDDSREDDFDMARRGL